jgi:hypothetical protein
MITSSLFPWDFVALGTTTISHEEDIFSTNFQNRFWIRVVEVVSLIPLGCVIQGNAA